MYDAESADRRTSGNVWNHVPFSPPGSRPSLADSDARYCVIIKLPRVADCRPSIESSATIKMRVRTSAVVMSLVVRTGEAGPGRARLDGAQEIAPDENAVIARTMNRLHNRSNAVLPGDSRRAGLPVDVDNVGAVHRELPAVICLSWIAFSWWGAVSLSQAGVVPARRRCRPDLSQGTRGFAPAQQATERDEPCIRRIPALEFRVVRGDFVQSAAAARSSVACTERFVSLPCHANSPCHVFATVFRNPGPRTFLPVSGDLDRCRATRRAHRPWCFATYCCGAGSRQGWRNAAVSRRTRTFHSQCRNGHA